MLPKLTTTHAHLISALTGATGAGKQAGLAVPTYLRAWCGNIMADAAQRRLHNGYIA
jgi:hypothetical protein